MIELHLINKVKLCNNMQYPSLRIVAKGEEVNWWKLIWFKEAIPNHSFIGWLVIRNRLSTKARLMEWGLGGDYACLYCRQSIEDTLSLVGFGSKLWHYAWFLILLMIGIQF